MNGVCDRPSCGQPARWRPILLLYPQGADRYVKPSQFILEMEVCCQHGQALKPHDLIHPDGWGGIEHAFAALNGLPLDRDRTMVAMRPAGNPELN